MRNVNQMDLEVGMIVHFYGARFEIISTKICAQPNHPKRSNVIMVAVGKWLDGNIENGYFGPDKDWNFQGNFRVSHQVE